MLTVVFANDTNSLAIRIRAIREIRSSLMVHIIKFNVQSSNFKGKGVQCSNLKPQRVKGSNHKVQWIKIISVISEIRSCYDFTIMIRKIRNMYSNFFYILVDERVGERVKNVLFRCLCKYFILN